MAKINLLPWRDEYRQEKKKEFTTVFAGVCIFAALVAYLWINTVEGAIENQNSRNTLLQQEIAALEEQVKEIQELKRRKAELIDRMRVIQDLQGTRPVIVRYFDELVRSVPDGIFITLLSRKGNVISIEGVTESNNRVSTFMRRLDASEWFSTPNLNSVAAAEEFGEQASEFKLTVSTAVPGSEDENAGGGILEVALADIIQQLRDFDLGEVDWDRVGVWPTPVKVIVCLIAFLAIVAGGYFAFVKDLNLQLDTAVAKEQTLRSSFEAKAFEASNLEAYRAQMVEMEESFGALVAQLPSDTEVPGLLEDIDEKGSESGLNILSIALLPENVREFYVELPIQIEVQGGYHDLGSFVSGIAGMPRIVTLHDYDISRAAEGNVLGMEILARTYRYKAQEE